MMYFVASVIHDDSGNETWGIALYPRILCCLSCGCSYCTFVGDAGDLASKKGIDRSQARSPIPENSLFTLPGCVPQSARGNVAVIRTDHACFARASLGNAVEDLHGSHYISSSIAEIKPSTDLSTQGGRAL